MVWPLWFLDVAKEAGLGIVQGHGAGSFARGVHAEAGIPGVWEAGVLDWTRGRPVGLPNCSPVGQRPADPEKGAPELWFPL